MSWSPRLYAPTVSRHGHALAAAAAAAAAVGAIVVVGLMIDAEAPAEVVLQSSDPTVISIRPVAPAPKAIVLPTPGSRSEAPPVAAPAPANSTKPSEQRPTFDILRLEPDGAAVIAGHASSNAALELRADGQVVAQATANRLGDFTMSPPPFVAGPHHLELAARSGTSPALLSDFVAIDVPAPEAKAAAAPAPAPGTDAVAPQAAPAAASATDASSSELNSPRPSVASASQADGVTVVPRTPTPPPRPNFARLPTKYSEVSSVKSDKTRVALVPSPTADPPHVRGGHPSK